MCLNYYDYLLCYLKHMELTSLIFDSHECVNHPGWCFANHAHFILLSSAVVFQTTEQSSGWSVFYNKQIPPGFWNNSTSGITGTFYLRLFRNKVLLHNNLIFKDQP
jgi:hypothetical protein